MNAARKAENHYIKQGKEMQLKYNSYLVGIPT